MPWRANVVYSAPAPSVIDAFRRLGFGDALYVVRDLEGIRFSWTRDQFFGSSPGEIKHGLPHGGVLAVMPPITRSNYDVEFPPQRAHSAAQVEDWGEGYAAKWGMEVGEIDGLERAWPVGLHRELSAIADATDCALFHYACETSGGPPDLEVAFVAQPNTPIATYTGDDLLQRALLDVLGLELPTEFFALHESSFDWSRYRLSGS